MNRSLYYFKKLITALLILLIFPLSFIHANDIPKSKILKVGYFENEVFQEGATPGSPRKGYAYEYYRKISEFTGWKYEYVFGDFNYIYNKFQKGEIDLLAGLAYQKERENFALFPSEPMGFTHYYMIKKSDNSSITDSPASLNGKKIGVLKSAMLNSLESWKRNHNVKAETVIFNNNNELFNSYAFNKVDAIIVEGFGTYIRHNSEVICNIGKSDFYLCITKNRPDLLVQLNEAQTRLNDEAPTFKTFIYNKFYASTVSSKVLSISEKEWLAKRGVINIGYYNNYAPYCFTDKNGKAAGILVDVVEEIFNNLKLNTLAKVNFIPYKSTDELIFAIQNESVDLIFPVGGSSYYLEENNLYQSAPVVTTNVSLVYSRVNPENAKVFAINRNNKLQEFYIKTNFSYKDFKYYDSVEECLNAVKNRQADCTSLNGLRADQILKNAEFSSLNSVSSPFSDLRAFGVKIGNPEILRIFNRGIATVSQEFISNRGLHYAQQLYRYSLLEFLRDNYLFVLIVVAIIALIIIVFVLSLNQRKSIYLINETKKNEELQMSKETQDFQLKRIRSLLDELKKTQKNSERFITEMVRYASSEDNPERILNQLIQFIGINTDSDRVYIIEENSKGLFDNTYEWCKSGITHEIDNLKDIPYDNVIEIWYQEFMRSGKLIINDVDEYEKVSKKIYDILKPQNIQSLIAAPLKINGKIIGFIGVDNPPYENFTSVADYFSLIDFIFSMMIQLRNNTRQIEESALHDQLTGCKNRKALTWAFDGKFKKGKSFAIIACDMNGLKQINDTQGHEAGDRFICRLSDTLSDIFGADNVYRMGGDEFIVVLTDISKDEFDKLSDASLIQLGSTASLGFAYKENMDVDFLELLNSADKEMYMIKDKFYQNKRKKNN